MSAASAAGLSGVHFRPQFRRRSNSSTVALHPLHVSSPKLQFLSLRLQRFTVSCSSGNRPGGSTSGDSESKNVLDAFFLGKALGEALSERLESTVGELLSTVGRLQAEQQKQVQDFQDEVFERAKKAKEKAAREAMEAQGLITKSSTANKAQVEVGNTSSSSIISPSNSLTENGSSPSTSATEDNTNGKSEDDPSFFSISIED